MVPPSCRPSARPRPLACSNVFTKTVYAGFAPPLTPWQCRTGASGSSRLVWPSNGTAIAGHPAPSARGRAQAPPLHFSLLPLVVEKNPTSVRADNSGVTFCGLRPRWLALSATAGAREKDGVATARRGRLAGLPARLDRRSPHRCGEWGRQKKRTRGNRVREEGGVKPRPLWPTRRRRGGIGRCTKPGGGASPLRGDRRRASRSGERARSPQRARQHGQLRRRQRRR